VAAPPPPVVVPAPAALKAQCERLVLALTPAENIQSQVDQLMAAFVGAMQTQNQDFMGLEKRYPGLIDAVAVKMRPILVKTATETLPLYRADLLQFYQSNLSLEDARAAADFFGSSDGQALIRSATESIDYKRSAGALMREEDASAKDIEADKRSAGLKVAQDLSPKLRIQVMTFFRTPAGQRLIALGPAKSAIDRKWFNYSRPEDEKAVEMATIEAMLEHIAKTDPATAKAMRASLVADGTIPKS